MVKEKIVLWGAGRDSWVFDLFQNVIETFAAIVCYVDSDIQKIGKNYLGYEICPPSVLPDVKFDKVVILSNTYFFEIKSYLIEQLKIPIDTIENEYCFQKKLLINRYKGSSNTEIKKIVEYLKQHKLTTFNYEFVEKYNNKEIEIQYDNTVNMHYVFHQGKKMYFPCDYDEARIKEYYKAISIEQDPESPHRYLDDSFTIMKGDVVVDAGAAEGNFSLDIIEDVSKLYLIESDEKWIKALKQTFSEYKEKVVFINNYVSDFQYGKISTLDDLIQEPINFLKMDIEGSEMDALNGAKKLIEKSPDIKCAICAYHEEKDEIALKSIMETMGFNCCFTNGYMWFPSSNLLTVKLRKGILRGEKQS